MYLEKYWVLVLDITSLIAKEISAKEFNNWVFVCLDGGGESETIQLFFQTKFRRKFLRFTNYAKDQGDEQIELNQRF
jgi:hypothetical protein